MGTSMRNMDYQGDSVRQPTTSKRVVPDRQFDKSQLKAGSHGGYVHRDYMSHALRWGWISRQMNKGRTKSRILDVGCGQEYPMVSVLSYPMGNIPELYVGVDMNGIRKPPTRQWGRVMEKFDFTARYAEIPEMFTDAVCLEVIEHMGTVDGRKLLNAIRAKLVEGGTLYLSTPVFNGRAAANHIHEYTIPELNEMVHDEGFTVSRRIGTFASKHDIIKAAGADSDPSALVMYNRLESWFGGEVMSTFLAPLYPDASRNNLWVLRKAR